MNEKDLKETALMLRDEIAKAKDLTSDVDIDAVFFSAETIISCLSYLISPIADMEQAYRRIVRDRLIAEDSNAKAEAIAKASEEYKSWKKYSALYDLGHEQVMVLKKFRDNLALERRRII
jgi:hypothetical protein